jgi:endoglucanase
MRLIFVLIRRRIALLGCGLAVGLGSAQSPYPSYNTDPRIPDLRGMGSSAVELAGRVTLGWNMGNTLEAIGGETAWGNPRISAELVQLIKDSGFDAIRLPAAWNQYADPATAAIDPAWLDRVKEVVQLCLDHDLVTILNIHWDGGWLENNVTVAKQAENNARQRAFWEQIATHLRDFDERLLFASANEPHVQNATQMEVLLSYHQTFIDAVRATGGRNAFRVLVVQGPLTDIELTRSLMTRMPDDTLPGRLMAEVHFYTPFNFTLMDSDQSWGKMAYYWGEGYHSATDPTRNAEWGEEDWVDTLFGWMKARFVDEGIPVVLGEYSAMRRSSLPRAQREPHLASRAYYHEYVTRRANELGLLPFYWDNGGTGNHASGIFNRHTRTVFDTATMTALVAAATAPTYWAQAPASPHDLAANADGDWANNLLELFLGSDPADPASVPSPPTARMTTEGRLALAVPRFSRVVANLQLRVSHDLVTWADLPFTVETDTAELLELHSAEPLADVGMPAFVTLEVSP